MKKESSFSEEKEAKKLLSIGTSPPGATKRKRIKVFGSFFKKNNFFSDSFSKGPP